MMLVCWTLCGIVIESLGRYHSGRSVCQHKNWKNKKKGAPPIPRLVHISPYLKFRPDGLVSSSCGCGS